MRFLRFLWKVLFCQHHELTFLRNIYGDEINLVGGMRSVWWCPDCGESIYQEELYQAGIGRTKTHA